MHATKGVSTSMAPGQKLQTFGSSLLTDPSHYRSIVGALQYITVTVDPIA